MLSKKLRNHPISILYSKQEKIKFFPAVVRAGGAWHVRVCGCTSAAGNSVADGLRRHFGSGYFFLHRQDLFPPAECAGGARCWIGYRGKCYYFSEAERNWTCSLTHCSVLSASLAEINSEQEMAFVLRYKGRLDHWIGLWRDTGQLWKWANGTKFNNLDILDPSPWRQTDSTHVSRKKGPSLPGSEVLQGFRIHLSSAAHVSDRTWLPFIDPQLFPSAEPEKLQSESPCHCGSL
ncbi:uncharacterized protein LOC142069205 [Caretta caretta]|uniref:uncharacterized protein LOC142069205 n=1 Tax=Caretta caretta TaxID=8467 RepID=UPI003F4BA99A